MAAEEGREKPQHVKYEGDHEWRLWPGTGKSIICQADDVLAKDRFDKD